MDRRAFLKTTTLGSVAAGFARLPNVWANSTADNRWRAFEITTRLEILTPSGVTRAWVPLPLGEDTDYHRTLGRTWSGNAATAQAIREPRYGAEFVVAEWPAGTGPVLEVVNRIATRNRQVDLAGPATAPAEDPAALRRYLEPTQLIPIDGIVEGTAREITKTAASDVEKARALYEWIVDHTFRDPKVRGCGLGDIRTMLETKNLGGKCADLNALFVGFARSVGIPARDVYGIRIADSADFKSLGRRGDITKAQHCRAEFYAAGRGWVPVDPADVRKVVLEEKAGGLPLDDPQVRKARAKLFGSWEMNWLAYNYAHDLALPGSTGPTLGFLMYPQAETVALRLDCLDPETFRYTIKSREIAL
jgi:transglutaminase-like putative cysteine protease